MATLPLDFLEKKRSDEKIECLVEALEAASHVDSGTESKAPEVPGGTGRRSGILGFFSGLPREAAEEVEQMAENITYTEEEERALCRKLDLRLLPLISFSYIFNQLNQTNIQSAHLLDAFNNNFDITSNKRWTLSLSIFFVGYCLLGVPSIILQRHIGANRFFFLSMLWWGLCSLTFVYTKGYIALLILQVMLGIGEAGYYAGMIYYMSFWYKHKELAFRISLSMSGVVPVLLGGTLSFVLVKAKTPALERWQFLCLFEAIPTLILAIAILFRLPSFPFTATFLTPREKAIAVARLKEHKPKSHGGVTGLEGLKLAMVDPSIWMFAILYCSCDCTLRFHMIKSEREKIDVFVVALQNICAGTVSDFLSTVVDGFGFSAFVTRSLAGLPYMVGSWIVVGQAWHSDKTEDRGYHTMLSAMVTFIGYVILATCAEKSLGASYFATYLVVGGAYSMFPLAMSWAANNTAPTSKRGVGIALIVSISNCALSAAPQIYFDSTDSFRKAHAVAAGFMLLAFVMAFILRTRFDVKNKHREAKLATWCLEDRELGDAAAAACELPDADIRFRFMT